MSEIKNQKIQLDPEKFKEKYGDVIAALKDKVGEKFKSQIKTMVEQRVKTYAYLYLICAAIILLLFVFLGYKLYKFLTGRGRRKEEKKKQKQEKQQKKEK